MGNGPLAEGNPYEVFLCVLNTFGDGGSHFICLSEAISYYTVLVTYDNNGSKLKLRPPLSPWLLSEQLLIYLSTQDQ